MIQGKEVPRQELIDLFEPAEGSVNMYYGRIGNGKTYSATADILDLLSLGRVVYCNWHINFEGFDEREHFLIVLMKTVFFKKHFFKFPKENLHYFSPDDVDIEFLSSINDADVFIDEGQWIFDSYEQTRFSKAKRKLILHTRHMNRSLNIISQRTQAIQVTARGQINRFFKCTKKMNWPFLVFQREEFQDMVNNDVDETQRVSAKVYFAKKRVLNAYNSKYLRGGVAKSQEVYFSAYRINTVKKLGLLFQNLASFFPLKRKETRKLDIKHENADQSTVAINKAKTELSTGNTQLPF